VPAVAGLLTPQPWSAKASLFLLSRPFPKPGLEIWTQNPLPLAGLFPPCNWRGSIDSPGCPLLVVRFLAKGKSAQNNCQAPVACWVTSPGGGHGGGLPKALGVAPASAT